MSGTTIHGDNAPPMRLDPQITPCARARSPAGCSRVSEIIAAEAVELAARTPVSGVTVTTQLVVGYAADGLLSTLEGADRLVLGSRGRGTFSELLLGSVSLELASRAPCPVVVIRDGAETLPDGTEAHRVVVGVDGKVRRRPDSTARRWPSGGQSSTRAAAVGVERGGPPGARLSRSDPRPNDRCPMRVPHTSRVRAANDNAPGSVPAAPWPR